MDNKDNRLGFSGLSDLTSDTLVSSTGQHHPTSQKQSAPQKAVFSLLSWTKFPTAPVSWSSTDAGETWVWGDFFLTFQKSPKTVLDFTMEMQGKKAEYQGMTYHYAMSVFYHIDRNPHGPSKRPIMVVALEQADMSKLAKMFGSETRELLKTEDGRIMGRLMVGLFTGETRSNLGFYEGDTNPQTVKQRFFDILSLELGVGGQPKMIGDLAQAFGHPETGLPVNSSEPKPKTKCCVPPPTDTVSSGKSDGSSGGNWIWIFGIVGVIFVIWLSNSGGQSNKKPSYSPPSSSQGYSYPQSSPAPAVQTPSTTQIAAGLQYTKPSVDTNNMLSVPEISWCIRESMRIEAMRDIIDTNAGVDEINRVISDYDSRCGDHYRYREDLLSQAKRDFEPYKSQVVAEVIKEAKALLQSERLVSQGSLHGGDGELESIASSPIQLMPIENLNEKFKVEVKALQANVRLTPEKYNNIIGVVIKGQQLSVIDTVGSYFLVSTSSGNAYIHNSTVLRISNGNF